MIERIKPPKVRERIWWGYRIIGNQQAAIAIDIVDSTNTQYFDIDPEVNNDAFIRACGWAYINHDTLQDEYNTEIKEI